MLTITFTRVHVLVCEERRMLTITCMRVHVLVRNLTFVFKELPWIPHAHTAISQIVQRLLKCSKGLHQNVHRLTGWSRRDGKATHAHLESL
jgi:hypothetical protein